MCDQDVDGFHIKGLLMNFFHYFWPSLLENHNYIQALATPIVKATRHKGGKKDVKTFYNLSEYDNWIKSNPESNSYSIKYYKGLGTSTKEEAKEYFTDINNKLIKYIWKNGNYNNSSPDILDEDIEDSDSKIEDFDSQIEDSDSKKETNNINKKKTKSKTDKIEETDKADILYKKVQSKSEKLFGVKMKYENHITEAVTLAFEKRRTNCRKVWLNNYNKDRIISNDQKNVPIPDFIHKELIHFSNDDINRSIPSLVDGLKPSTRKILYGAILRKLDKAKDEIKVSQLSGFVSDKSCYHHGEASLQGAIVGMAQNFVGSNNINLLFPSGQYGTRLIGGKDAASSRYIFTYLAELTRIIFRQEDDPILNYLDDDGSQVEPEYYCPIIPMVLVNGAEGIGTGFSTFISKYNPLDIVENIKLLLDEKDPKVMMPYYRNFTGSIDLVPNTTNEFIIKGCYNRINNDTLRITELPIGSWTTPYREFLESKTEKVQVVNKKTGKTKNVIPLIELYKCNYTDDTVNFTVQIDPITIDKMLSSDTLLKKLKLVKSMKLKNMHLYNSSGQIKKYNTPLNILNEFYEVRLLMYTKRKVYIIIKLLKELTVLKYKKQFIEDVLNNTIIIYKQKKSDILDKLVELKYPKLSKTSDNSNESNNIYNYMKENSLFNFKDEKIRDIISDLIDKYEINNSDKSYDYITDIPLFNLTQEKIDDLIEKFNNKNNELEKAIVTTEKEQWLIELNEFETAYIKWNNVYSIIDNKNVIKSNLQIITTEKETKKETKKIETKKIETKKIEIKKETKKETKKIIDKIKTKK
jgi:DNA topoisomerase-2